MAGNLLSNGVAGIQQFAFGKLIRADGQDVRGYDVIAKSNPSPKAESIRTVSDQGNISNLDVYPGSDMSFSTQDYAFVARFQRSPRPYARGYFLQEHYLAIPRQEFAKLGNNYSYFYPLLPAEIPWRSGDEQLPLLQLPVRHIEQERARVESNFHPPYQQKILDVVQLLLDSKPFVIQPESDVTPEKLMYFLEVVCLLFPATCRADVSWAINVVDVRRSRARIKVVGPSTGSVDGYLIVRLSEKTSSTSTALNDPKTVGGYYRTYLQQFMANFSLRDTLQQIENLPVAPGLSWEQIGNGIATTWWHVAGPVNLNKELEKASRPYTLELLNVILQTLNDKSCHITAPQMSSFLTAIFTGALDGVVPTSEASRIAANYMMAGDELLPEVEHIMAVYPILSNPNRLLETLNLWHQNSSFANSQHGAWLLYCGIKSQLIQFQSSPDKALSFLRRTDISYLVPDDENFQKDLLQTAIEKSNSQNKPRPANLIAAWASMVRQMPIAIRVARALPELEKIIWKDTASPFSFIPLLLKGRPTIELEGNIANRKIHTLKLYADTLLELALMGERVGVPTMRSEKIIHAIIQGITEGNPSPGSGSRLVDKLVDKIDELNQPVQDALVGLIFVTGKLERYKVLLEQDWRRIDPLINWLKKNNAMTSSCKMGFDVVIEWMQISSASIPTLERHRRLRDIFTHWARLTRGTPDSVGRLAALLLQDAFQGIGEDKGPSGFFANIKGVVNLMVGNNEKQKLIEKTITGIQFAAQNIFQSPNFKNTPIGQSYAAILETAFENHWKKREWTGDLIGALRKNGLDFEASCISRINIRKRGLEVVNLLFSNLEGNFDLQLKLYNLMSEISGLEARDVNSLFSDPKERVRLKEYCQYFVSNINILTKEMNDFQQKL